MLCSAPLVNKPSTSTDVKSEPLKQHNGDVSVKRKRSPVSATAVKVAKTDPPHAKTVKSENQNDVRRFEYHLRHPKTESSVKTESPVSTRSAPSTSRKKVMSR